MADEENPSTGDAGRGEHQRSREERADFSNLILQWAATVETMRALVNAWDISVGNLRGTSAALDRNDRNRKIAAALKTIESMRLAEQLSESTRDHLQQLIARLET